MFKTIAIISALSSCQSSFIYSMLKNFSKIDKSALVQFDAFSEILGSGFKVLFGYFHNSFKKETKLISYLITTTLLVTINLTIFSIFLCDFKHASYLFLILWVLNRITNGLSGISRDFFNLIFSKKIEEEVIKLKAYKNTGNLVAIIISYYDARFLLVIFSFCSIFLCLKLRFDKKVLSAIEEDSKKIEAYPDKRILIPTLFFILSIFLIELPHLSEQMLYINCLPRGKVMFFKTVGQIISPFILAFFASEKMLMIVIPFNYLIASYFLSSNLSCLSMIGCFIWGTNITLSQSYAVILASKNSNLKSFLLGLGTVFATLCYLFSTVMSCILAPIKDFSFLNYKLNFYISIFVLIINLFRILIR